MSIQADRLLIACTARMAKQYENKNYEALTALQEDVETLKQLIDEYKLTNTLSEQKLASYKEQVHHLETFIQKKMNK